MAKSACSGRIFPSTCRKAQTATKADEDSQDDNSRQPPGSGKSSVYPLSDFGFACFNADDRAAELNGSSYVAISNEIRSVVNREFESFIHGSIERRVSFAIQTTLRSEIIFEQARLAKQAGFAVEMRYLALRNFGLHLIRVKGRAFAGGHSASEPTLRRIYNSSLINLPPRGEKHRFCPGLRQHKYRPKPPADDPPEWLTATLDL